VSAREEGNVAVALVAAGNGREEVVWSVAAAELVLPGGGEMEAVAGDTVVVVEHEVGDGFAGAFEHHVVEVHH